MEITFTFMIFIGTIASLFGFYIAYLCRSKTGFSWLSYTLLLFAPTLVTFLNAYLFDIRILYLYALSATAGMLTEFGLGFAYHKIMGEKMWVYTKNRFVLGPYTSLLTLPMWGIAGAVFWTISELLGM